MRREIDSATASLSLSPSGRWLVCGHRVDSDGEDLTYIDCLPCDRRERPDSLTEGRRTPTFTADSVPPALLAAHLTKAWAELIVLHGTVRFFDDDPPWEAEATPDRPVVIVPDRLHHIEPGADAEFAVQFYDYPARS